MTTRKITSCSKVTRSAQRWLKGTVSRTLPFWLSAESRSGDSTLLESLPWSEASSPPEGSLWSHHTLFRINSTNLLNSQSNSSLSHLMAGTPLCVLFQAVLGCFFLPPFCSFIRDDKQRQTAALVRAALNFSYEWCGLDTQQAWCYHWHSDQTQFLWEHCLSTLTESSDFQLSRRLRENKWQFRSAWKMTCWLTALPQEKLQRWEKQALF